MRGFWRFKGFRVLGMQGLQCCRGFRAEDGGLGFRIEGFGSTASRLLGFFAP